MNDQGEKRPGGKGGQGGGPASPSRRSHPVVVSSRTGKPIPWEDDADGADDAPRSTDPAHDARIAGDIPPHWGKR